MLSQFESTLRSKPKSKYIQIGEDHLELYAQLTPRQRKLLMAMVRRLNLTHMPDSFIGSATYGDFGYDRRQSYHKDKKALEVAGFIVTDASRYFVRLDAVMYASKRGYKHLLNAFGIWDDGFGDFGKFPVPPPPQ